MLKPRVILWVHKYTGRELDLFFDGVGGMARSFARFTNYAKVSRELLIFIKSFIDTTK